MPRNVFVLIDGTMCSSDTGSNIIRIQEVIDDDSNNEWIYAEGIASLSSAKWLQTALPTEIATEAINLYKMLTLINVTAGDRLIIIGYSRGAIVARILAQMITNDIAFRNVVGISDRARKIVPRKTVDFLGLFDPVRGWPYPFKVVGYDADAQNNQSIKNITEIISIDEGYAFFKSDASIVKRKTAKSKFKVLNSLAQKRESKKQKAQSNKSITTKASRHFCLFPGVHSDIGGQEANIALSSTSTIMMLAELVHAFPDILNSFNDEKLASLKASLENHPDIIVGAKTSFWRRLFSFPRKLIPDESTTIHPLAIELRDRRRVTRAVRFHRWRKYRIKKAYHNCPETSLQDI